MNGFDQARAKEAKAMAILMPFLQESTEGHFVLVDGGPLAKALQQSEGDVLLSARSRLYSVEIKAEEKWTGNLYLESWSNKNLDNIDNHVLIGSNPGWMLKLKSMLLFYYFLDTDRLYVVNLFRLQQWAFGCNGKPPRIHSYPEKRQGVHTQKNDTWGWCVPLTDIHREVGYRLLHPRQISLPNVIDTSLVREDKDA